MKQKVLTVKTLAADMKKVADKYNFKLFSVDLIDYFNDSSNRECHQNSIIFSTPNTEAQEIIFLSYWKGTWNALADPEKYKVWLHVTQPDFTQNDAINFTRELNHLTSPEASPLKPLDFISLADWQQMAED